MLKLDFIPMLDPEEKELFIVLSEYSCWKFSMFCWTIRAKVEWFLGIPVRNSQLLIKNVHFLVFKSRSPYIARFFYKKVFYFLPWTLQLNKSE